MSMTRKFGRRILRNSLVLTTTVLTCAALQAEEHKSSQGTPATAQSGQQQQYQSGQAGQSRPAGQSGLHGLSGQSGQQQHGQAEQFVKKALKSGKMEVQMGQLAQQKGHSPQVKELGQTLVRDHTQANQRLQQIASSKNINVGQEDLGAGQQSTRQLGQQQSAQQLGQKAHDGRDDMKGHEEMAKIQGLTGQEFDKAFLTQALKHHQKDIQSFEQARNQVNEPELRAFIDQTLPKLRQHLQMAQNAAREAGVDTANLSDDNQGALGSPASGATGTRESDNLTRPIGEEPRSSLDRDAGSDLEIDTDNRSLDADADLTRTDSGITTDVDADVDDGGIFQKGDGKILGLPTDKNDGTFLGIIPNPGADNDNDADIEVDVDTDADESAVGGAASSEVGRDSR